MRIADGAPLNISELKMATHIGTHVDAPWHFVPEGKTIDQIPLDLISENLTNLDQIAGQRVEAYLFPIKIRDSDAGQTRAVALV